MAVLPGIGESQGFAVWQGIDDAEGEGEFPGGLFWQRQGGAPFTRRIARYEVSFSGVPVTFP